MNTSFRRPSRRKSAHADAEPPARPRPDPVVARQLRRMADGLKADLADLPAACGRIALRVSRGYDARVRGSLRDDALTILLAEMPKFIEGRSRGGFRAWASMVLSSRAKDLLRKLSRGRELTVEPTVTDDGDEPAGAAELGERLTLIRNTLNELGRAKRPKHFETFLLAVRERIAKKLGRLFRKGDWRQTPAEVAEEMTPVAGGANKDLVWPEVRAELDRSWRDRDKFDPTGAVIDVLNRRGRSGCTANNYHVRVFRAKSWAKEQLGKDVWEKGFAGLF